LTSLKYVHLRKYAHTKKEFGEKNTAEHLSDKAFSGINPVTKARSSVIIKNLL